MKSNAASRHRYRHHPAPLQRPRRTRGPTTWHPQQSIEDRERPLPRWHAPATPTNERASRAAPPSHAPSLGTSSSAELTPSPRRISGAAVRQGIPLLPRHTLRRGTAADTSKNPALKPGPTTWHPQRADTAPAELTPTRRRQRQVEPQARRRDSAASQPASCLFGQTPSSLLLFALSPKRGFFSHWPMRLQLHAAAPTVPSRWFLM